VLGRPKMRRCAAELEREYAVTEGQSLPASALQRGGLSDARSRRSSPRAPAVGSRQSRKTSRSRISRRTAGSAVDTQPTFALGALAIREAVLRGQTPRTTRPEKCVVMECH
jgi:hypothetical protein